MSQKIMLNYKLILVGDSNTGKTAILNQYIYHTFTNTKATTGIDYFTKMFEIDDFIVKLNIFDTAGQQRYLAMTKSYFRGANAVLFTYSLMQKQSFLNLPSWIRKFQDQAGREALKIVVGTKKDLKPALQSKPENNMNFPSKINKDKTIDENNQPSIPKQKEQFKNKVIEHSIQNSVSQDQMQSLLKNQGITFSFETSALLNQNIDEVFQEICKFLILKEMNKKNTIPDSPNRSKVETQFSKSKSKSSEVEDQKLSLQQRRNQLELKNQSCC